jgi:heme oxygenase (biliverdin-IX-beta and delta-forming)
MHTVFKDETALFHKRLNLLPNIRILINSNLNASNYIDAMSAFAQAYNFIEPKLISLERKIQLNNIQAYIPKLPSILNDIESFGEHAPQQHIKYREYLPPIQIQEASHYFGLRYVLDGTSQGGKYIEQRLRKNVPQIVERAFSFWGVQQATSRQWPFLCESITELAKHDEYRRQMIASAKTAFQVFINCCSLSYK